MHGTHDRDRCLHSARAGDEAALREALAGMLVAAPLLIAALLAAARLFPDATMAWANGLERSSALW